MDGERVFGGTPNTTRETRVVPGVFGFYYHYKYDEKLTVMFSVESPGGEAVGTSFFRKTG